MSSSEKIRFRSDVPDSLRQPPAHPIAAVLLNELSVPPENPLDPRARAGLRARRAGRQQGHREDRADPDPGAGVSGAADRVASPWLTHMSGSELRSGFLVLPLGANPPSGGGRGPPPPLL